MVESSPVEGTGDSAGGGDAGPPIRVLIVEDREPHLARFDEALFGELELASLARQIAEVVNHRRHLGMLLPERLTPNRQRFE